ncbi:hypothetical protein [Tuwongella immobilis]|uniref:Uncharacterized protein n=1 Tax=Tuwongella immobilis TaxID=692036 RepID=A0A6C2YW24_9BACT|nr:hypothetical protein [Tuwongella immobilis]VIP05577.1 unnamed protein product [Tuwongella immobilis]VTS08509.1 unnamed protein product [Tuwongella immobilis]
MSAIDILNRLADAGEAHLKQEAENRERQERERLAHAWSSFLATARTILGDIFPIPETAPASFDGKHTFSLPFYPFGIAVWADIYHNITWKLSGFRVVVQKEFSRIQTADLLPEQFQYCQRLDVAIALARRVANQPISTTQPN